MNKRPRIVISQYRLLHYRISLFEKLRALCDGMGMDLEVVYGQPTRRERAKRDVGELAWATQTRNVYVPVAGRDILWQLHPRELRHPDMLIVMQENRLLSNYPWLLGLRGPSTKVAYWGHGKNFQSRNPAGFKERLKRNLLNLPDWWFAYTELSKDIVLSNGYPERQITVLNNSIDTARFREELASVTDADIAQVRAQYGIQPESPVALFCGSLYAEKRLDYLITAARQIRLRVPDLVVLIVGDGPERRSMQKAAEDLPWIKFVGVQYGAAKATYFRISQLLLNPGLVGLHVLDSFCAGKPMLTTTEALHSPEIAYLKNGENGLIVSGGMDAFVDAAASALNRPDTLERLSRGALRSADVYSVQNMAQRFASGISSCLGVA